MSKETMERFEGREVACLWYACEADQIRPMLGQRLLFDYQYHGTYDTSWIVLIGADGKELQRHNVARLGGWSWNTTESGTDRK